MKKAVTPNSNPTPEKFRLQAWKDLFAQKFIAESMTAGAVKG